MQLLVIKPLCGVKVLTATPDADGSIVQQKDIPLVFGKQLTTGEFKTAPTFRLCEITSDTHPLSLICNRMVFDPGDG
jgi:hypothetical protein